MFFQQAFRQSYAKKYWLKARVFGCNHPVQLLRGPVENRACALLEGPMPRFVIKRGVLVARDGELTDAVPTCPE